MLFGAWYHSQPSDKRGLTRMRWGARPARISGGFPGEARGLAGNAAVRMDIRRPDPAGVDRDLHVVALEPEERDPILSVLKSPPPG